MHMKKNNNWKIRLKWLVSRHHLHTLIINELLINRHWLSNLGARSLSFYAISAKKREKLLESFEKLNMLYNVCPLFTVEFRARLFF